MEKKGDYKGYSDDKHLDSKDSFCEGKSGESKGDEYLDEGKSDVCFDVPQIDVTAIHIEPSRKSCITDPLELSIGFALDRDVVAGYWEVKFLVDSANKRIIKILGRTPVEDYPDGESEMNFKVDHIDVSGIPPSTLTNSGLLMATFKVHGEEVASVNMVVNVMNEGGEVVREILSPLE
mmetsp:Transcript_26621/g.39552  ORF Transcript_26621/g.39552 Transcript_26621/m.39552 type:complete len:178 (+) Transcript_26621:96-629(+)|eukprot:CAMPEP_0185024956 /NCGR_PEP_ID=MMETSP1103-20130426/8104_1 /TAXON_ID=36769 /ORGANISM="Paraphysomonas bandaiensis, Strain Caron Lab Isolate" /LENGTH=177 /DNA_ID=CAMNT_0027558055 /DNA_START=80 /DNA_END=613 /DNA_ORIENTATION=+